MACELSTIQSAACLSGIGKVQSEVTLLQTIAQLVCEASEGGGSGDGVPVGVILMWSGSIATIPVGWAFCNGSNGTPDMRNLFVVGANADVAGQARTTIIGAAVQSGGSTTHTHGDSFVVTGSLAAGVAIIAAGGGSYLPNLDAGLAGTVQAEVTVPPFYALAYIMKL